LEVPSCSLEAGWLGGCTTTVVNGVLQFSGVDSKFATLSGVDGIKVGSFELRAKNVATGVINSTISGEVVEVRLANVGVVRSNAAFLAGGEVVFDVDTGARRRRHLLQDITGNSNEDYGEWFHNRGTPGKRRLLGAILQGDVYGDSTGDGVFTTADLLFLQQYYDGDETLGCAGEGGDGCQARETLSQWQLQQLMPIGRDESGDRDIPYGDAWAFWRGEDDSGGWAKIVAGAEVGAFKHAAEGALVEHEGQDLGDDAWGDLQHCDRDNDY